MADCNTLIWQGIEYSREEFTDMVRKGEIHLPSTQPIRDEPNLFPFYTRGDQARQIERAIAGFDLVPKSKYGIKGYTTKNDKVTKKVIDAMNKHFDERRNIYPTLGVKFDPNVGVIEFVSITPLARSMDEIDFDTHDFKSMPFRFSASKIMLGKKFITVRAASYKIGTYKAPNGKLFNIIPEGRGYLQEYLDNNNITKQDFIKDFIGDEEAKYKHIQNFLDGTEELFIYRIEKVMDRDDIIPDIADPRFLKVYENRMALIRRIKKQLNGEKDPTRAEELRARLDNLGKQAENLKDDDARTFAMLLAMMRSDVATVKKILDSKTDRRSLDFAKALISNYVDVLTKDFINEVDNLDAVTRDGILNFITEVTTLAGVLNKHYISIANAEVQRLTGKDQLKIDGTPVDADDTNLAAGWAYDSRWNKNPIVQSITKIIRDAQVSITLQLTSFRALNTKLVKALKKAGHNYDFMIQTDTQGKRTGLFVSRESAAYKEAKREASQDTLAHILFYAQNHKFTVNDAAWAQREAFLMDYYTNNNNITLNAQDDINGTTYDQKVKEFAVKMTFKKDPRVMKQIFDRIAKNPNRVTISDREFFSDFMDYGGFHSEKMGDTWVKTLEMVADDKWVDPKYQTILDMHKDDPRKAFYDHWMKYIEHGRRMRRDEDRYLAWNFIPEKYKPLGVLAKTNQLLYDHLGQRISNNKGEVDPETNEIEKKIPLYMLNNTLSPENKSYDLGNVLEDFVKETLNYEEKSQIEEPANMLLGMLRQQPVYDTNPDGSIKLDNKGNKRHKEGLSNNYIQAAHKLASSIYGESQDQEFVAAMKFYTADAQAEMKKLRIEIDNLGLTDAERSIATQYTVAKQPYDGANTKIAKYIELATKYQQVRDSGKNFTGSKFANTMMFLTSVKFLGLNMFAGFGELLQGYVGLFTESAARTYFTDKEAARAMGWVMKFLTPWDSPGKTKIQGVAKLFDTVGDIFHESEVRVKGKTEGIAFAQYKIANMGTNTSFTIAMLMHDKVKDKNGAEHSIWDAMDFEDGMAKWSKDIDIALYEDGKPTQYLIDLIHKSDEILALNRERKTFMDPTKVDAKMVGRLLGQFKKNWMIGMFYNRFGDKREANLTGGHEFEGFYKTFWKTVFALPKVTDPITGEERNDTSLRGMMSIPKNLLKFLFKFSTLGRITGNGVKAGEYNELVEANLRKFMREFSMAITLWSVMIVLSSMNGGDDRDPLRTYFINQLMRLHRDVTTFMSFDTLSSFIKNPAPVVSSVADYFQVVDAGIKSGIMGDPFNSNGDLRVWKAAKRNIPFLNQIDNLKSKFDKAVLYGKY